MTASTLVDDLIQEVRAQIDETNTTAVSDADILSALNRGQSFGVQIMARYYEDPFIEYAPLTLLSNQAEYTLPEGLFEDRLQKVEVLSPSGVGFEVVRMSYRDAYAWRSRSRVSAPSMYTLHSRTLTFYPTPNGTYQAKIWYMREPETLVRQQGQIVADPQASFPVLYLDSLGSDLSTASPGFANYINIVDAETGELKGSYQVQNLDPVAKTVTLNNTTPTRAAVLNHTISTSLAGTVAQDDYVCLVKGTCVPYYKTPLSNFLIQYAVAEIRRRLSAEPEKEMAVLKEFEAQVKATWSNRESYLRVKRRSNAWSRPLPWRRFDSY